MINSGSVISHYAKLWIYEPIIPPRLKKIEWVAIIQSDTDSGAIAVSDSIRTMAHDTFVEVSKEEWDPVEDIQRYIFVWSNEDDDEKAISLIMQKLHTT